MFFFSNDEEMVINQMNSTNIKFVRINNLFGRNDVVLNFDKEVNIYIGENGLGKTTILNCIYYVLTKRYDKLYAIPFDEIVIEFSNDSQQYSITKNDIREYNKKKIHVHKMYNRADAIEDIISDYLNDNRFMLDSEESIEICVRGIARSFELPFSLARQYVYEFIEHGTNNNLNLKGDKKTVDALNRAIDKNITQKVLYLTTYRRIENDFSKLIENNNRYRENDLLIRFGMVDVEDSINRILNLIAENSRESFDKMTGILLKQYSLSEKQRTKTNRKRQINKDVFKIILERLSSKIDEKSRNNILKLVDNERIYTEEYSYLLDLTIKLIESYEEYQKYDEKIKNFVVTCNKYLNGKKFVYDQSELKLYVRMEKDELLNDIVQLNDLSSGEKQIVSLFSKLYFETEKDSILIIDEPELSISMKWQKMLLPDIMRTGNCKLLLTVTHSPFIFDNEFDMDAKEMRHCIYNH